MVVKGRHLLSKKPFESGSKLSWKDLISCTESAEGILDGQPFWLKLLVHSCDRKRRLKERRRPKPFALEQKELCEPRRGENQVLLILGISPVSLAA